VILIFLHIPKAGGTTLRRILRRIYFDKEIFSIKVTDPKKNEVEQFRALPSAEKQRIDVLIGHMPFGLHKEFSQPTTYITFFRHPVNRIISHYEYVLREPSHYLYKKVKKGKMQFQEYALSNFSPELDNHQCRMLLGEPDDEKPFTEEKYNQVIQNLETHFAGFGIMEQFDKSLIYFRKVLGWQEYPFYVKLNTNPKPSDQVQIPDAVRNLIAEKNSWDMRLYAWANEKFEKNLATIPDLENELTILSTANGAYAEGLNERLSSGRVRHIIRSMATKVLRR
jgi:hypothetical protein